MFCITHCILQSPFCPNRYYPNNVNLPDTANRLPAALAQSRVRRYDPAEKETPMRAYQSIEPGQPPAFRDLPRTPPGAGELGVEIAACGLNFADLLMADGRYQDTPAQPFTLGMEFAGTVVEAGPGAAAHPPGTRVAVMGGSGGLADYANVAAARCMSAYARPISVRASRMASKLASCPYGRRVRIRARPGTRNCSDSRAKSIVARPVRMASITMRSMRLRVAVPTFQMRSLRRYPAGSTHVCGAL